MKKLVNKIKHNINNESSSKDENIEKKYLLTKEEIDKIIKYKYNNISFLKKYEITEEQAINLSYNLNNYSIIGKQNQKNQKINAVYFKKISAKNLNANIDISELSEDDIKEFLNNNEEVSTSIIVKNLEAYYSPKMDKTLDKMYSIIYDTRKSLNFLDKIKNIGENLKKRLIENELDIKIDLRLLDKDFLKENNIILEKEIKRNISNIYFREPEEVTQTELLQLLKKIALGSNSIGDLNKLEKIMKVNQYDIPFELMEFMFENQLIDFIYLSDNFFDIKKMNDKMIVSILTKYIDNDYIELAKSKFEDMKSKINNEILDELINIFQKYTDNITIVLKDLLDKNQKQHISNKDSNSLIVKNNGSYFYDIPKELQTQELLNKVMKAKDNSLTVESLSYNLDKISKKLINEDMIIKRILMANHSVKAMEELSVNYLSTMNKSERLVKIMSKKSSVFIKEIPEEFFKDEEVLFNLYNIANTEEEINLIDKKVKLSKNVKKATKRVKKKFI